MFTDRWIRKYQSDPLMLTGPLVTLIWAINHIDFSAIGTFDVNAVIDPIDIKGAIDPIDVNGPLIILMLTGPSSH